MKKVTIGIDIGGTNTQFGIVDENGGIIAQNSIPTTGYNDINAYIIALHSALQHELAGHDKKIDLVGIGIGAPNANYNKGTIEHAPNLDWPGIIPLCNLIKQYFDVPIAITNDANAAAIGEMVYGGAKGMKNFIVITLGTGLGSGIVVNGELVYGHTGFAGEMGHVTIVPSGRKCNCGRRGCLETYVSASGIKRTLYKILSDNNGQSNLSKISFEQMTSKMIADAANEGDKVAMEAFKQTGKKLGLAIVNVIATISPEAIFLFGGLAQAGELIFSPTRDYIEKNIQIIFKDTLQLLPSQISESNAAILGASALAWQEIRKNES